MSKIRMNTELRNKLFNKIKHTFENEDTQERELYLQSREYVDEQYQSASALAKEVVERSYPTEDVATLRTFKKKYGDPCDVVAKDNVFTLHTMKILTRTGTLKKLNHTLILVCLEI